jgi:hypothetical protein
MANTMTQRNVVSFCVAVCFLLSGSVVLSVAPPKIQFKEETWDFGKVKQGEILTHEFVFKNIGEAPLSIRKVRTSCGCTAALVSEQKVAPGKEGQIQVTFNSGGYGAKVAKSIYVDSDDPVRPNVELTIVAEIDIPPQPKIEIDRYNLDLGLLLEGEDLQSKIIIKNVGELELSVDCSKEKASFFGGGKPVSFPLKIAAGKSVEVEVRVPPQNKMGLIREYVLVHSNDPVRSTVSLYLSGYIITKKELKELFVKYKNILG